MRSPQEIASSLSLLADLMDINGDNEFKIRAHRVAADICTAYNQSTEALLAQISSPGIPKIGENLAKKIAALSQTAQIDEIRELTKSVPLSVLDLRRVPGLGPKKVKVLWNELKIADLDALEGACHLGQLKELKGFGEKIQDKILEGLAQLKKYQGLMLISRAQQLFELVAALVKQNFPDVLISASGEYRRSCEVCNRVDVLVSDLDIQKLQECFQNSGLFSSVASSDNILEMHTNQTELLKVFVVPRNKFYDSLLIGTGPEKFISWLAPKIKACEFESEEKIFEKAGIEFVIPEQRDLEGLWQKGSSKNLIQRSDLKGIVHCHSTYSDGGDELKNMALAAKDLGYQYLGVTDHSVSARYAGGLTLDKIKKQHKEIENLNEELAPFRILKGIESDITSEGNLDYEDKVLESFDFIIASIHGGFQMSREDMTARIVKAIRNPYTSILGHSTGRLLLEREGYDVDLEEVLRVAGAEGVVVEINSSPYRLDLDWRMIPYALDQKVKLSINPDAHRIKGFGDVGYGVAVARKAGLTKDSVVNCLDVEGFLKSLKGY